MQLYSLLRAFLLLQAASVSSSSVPSYTGPGLNASLPLGGLKKVCFAALLFTVHYAVLQIPNVEISCAHRGVPESGTYNHAAMIDYHDGLFLLAWKNGVTGEDDSNQRILYSTSIDGLKWSPTNGTNILFPGMTTEKQEAALFVGPPIIVNKRRYVGASVGKAPAGAAQGAQYCLWPDPLEPRNTVIVTKKNKEHQDILLMREIRADGTLGSIFWQSQVQEHTLTHAH